MTKLKLGIIALIAFPAFAAADEIDSLLGRWISPDGLVRQSIARTFDNAVIESKMWFYIDSKWRLVSHGYGYRRPGEKSWRNISRTREMFGIELFETTILASSATTFLVSNLAYHDDGEVVVTEEDWVFDGPDRFRYTIYRIVDGDRKPWMTGEWVRIRGVG